MILRHLFNNLKLINLNENLHNVYQVVMLIIRFNNTI